MSREPIINRFKQRNVMFDAVVARLVKRIRRDIERSGFCSLAFSGDAPLDNVFSILADKYSAAEFWTRVQLFWVDEWRVPPDAPESNYGRAWRVLSRIPSLLPANVHRIHAENPDAAGQYADLLNSGVLLKNDAGLPVFDIIVLGTDVDGHVAALLPYSAHIRDNEKVMVARVSDEKFHRERITITLPVINAGRKIIFLACGKEKIDLVQHVINRHSEEYPASLVISTGKAVEWYICL